MKREKAHQDETCLSMEIGNEYDVDITEVSRQGDGITRVQGFVVFVKNGKPGQKAKIKVNQVGNRFGIAAIVAGAEQQVT